MQNKSKLLTLKRFTRTRWFDALFGLLLFWPLLFLNIRSDHDWGGDFAQYLVQANNIAHCKPMAETNYVYNEAYPSLGPAAYPPGFPLIIAPIVARTGYSMQALNYLMSFILLSTSIVAILLLRRLISLPAALAAAMIFFYNPNLIAFKSEIMADIPFSLLVLLFLFIASHASKKHLIYWILAGAIGGFAATVKTAGISIGVALAVYLVMGVIVGFIREKSLPVALKQGFYPGWGVLSFVLVFFLISVLFSTKGTQETSTYINIFSLSNLETVVSTNIFNFSETIRTHFIINPYPHGWYGLLLGSAILVFSITGFIMAFIKGPGIIESFVFVYVLLILVYPYHHSGIRFLLPIAPVMLMYSAKVVASFKPANVFKWMVIAGAIVMFIIYLPPIVDSHKSRRTIIEGPYKPEVQTAFNMVQSLTGPEDLIVFLKPRVLAWAIERRCISHHPAAQADEMHKVFHDKGATHFLVYTGLHDPALHVYLSEYKDNFDCIMATDAFTLYRKKI